MRPKISASARRIKDKEAHVDDWLMTYADMITLLLCFFALLLAISVPRADRMMEAQKKVREQFSAPDILASKFPTQVDTTPRESVKAPPSILHGEGPQQQPAPQQEGVQVDQSDKITIIEMNSGTFFGSGSAELTNEGQAFLDQLLNDIADPKYQNYMITVEGHTDNRPINTLQYPSNWELSSGRAASVVRYFLEKGVHPERMRAAGYADAFPKVPNMDDNGVEIPENQAQNRRVVIKLEKIERRSLF